MLKTMSVSIVIPMYNAEKLIEKVLKAIFEQKVSLPDEVIVVNDGSTDNSLSLVKQLCKEKKINVIPQPNQGTVSATNRGFRTASGDIICSVDADVVLHNDWLQNILIEFNDPKVGAVQGYYQTPTNVSFFARMAGYDMEKRYDSMKQKYVTQVNTGNTAYRKSALDKVGFFDPKFTYAYDNDMSYRLLDAGYQLVFKKNALCDHYWKANINGYMRQQYWSGYGRMQVIRKHKRNFLGDTTSGSRMILQVPLTLTAIFLIIFGFAFFFATFSTNIMKIGIFILLGILIDRFIFSLSIITKRRDISAILLPFIHLLRNCVWGWAFLRWFLDIMRKEKKNKLNKRSC